MTVINLPIDYTPVNLADSGSDGLIWKQIIPLDKEIVYGGKRLKFTKALLDRLRANYEAGVTEQTAFQLADDQNRHDTEEDIAKNRNFDPQRYRGEIKKLVVDEKGLRGGFKLTDEGLNLIKNNQKLGVSASIKPNYVGEDGTVHDFVLRHVVGTLDPKIKHMSPWELEGITLSATDEPNEEVFDLTTVEPVKDADPATDSVTLSREEYDKMQLAIKEFENGEQLLDQILAEEDDDEVTPTNLSQESAKDPAIVALENRVAASDWRAEKSDLIRAGVPANLLNLCDDVMSTADDFTISLSTGDEVDPRDVIRKLLNEAKGTVDLSDENGHGKSADERQSEREAAESYADGFISQFNLGIF